MSDPVKTAWRHRLEACAAALEKRGFTAAVARNREQAARIMWEWTEEIAPRSVGMADSRTLRETGILERLSRDGRWEYIDGFDPAKERSENLEARRRALVTDLFLTGINAVVESGSLLWLDMVGNRIAGILYGPRNVILAVGRNKMTATREEAEQRIRSVAAPLNAQAHTHFRTPCQITSRCHDCNSPDRICNSWLIMERCYPPGRIRVVLIDEELGF